MTTTKTLQVKTGILEAKQGNTTLGLKLLNGSGDVSDLPEAKAWQGYCLAREKNAFRHGIAMCREALQSKPGSSDIYLALGRIYLVAGLRSAAISTLQKGLEVDKNPEIYRLLNSIGIRKPPVFRFLPRKSKVNVASGRLLAMIGLR